MNTIFRTALLILLAIFAATSNIIHAAVPPFAPVAVDHNHHHPQAAHEEGQTSCCDIKACIGCAVMPLAVVAPTPLVAMRFKVISRTPMSALAGRAALPDVPPPRNRS